MKRLKLEDLLRDSVSKYAALSLQLSKCNSRFSVQMFLDNGRLTSKSCDFGTWYFTQKSSMDLPSLKEVEAPYIKVFILYKKLEEQFNTKVSKLNSIKKKIPFIKFEQDPILEIISDLHLNCILLVNALKKIEAEYKIYQVINTPLYSTSTKISRKIDANLAIIQNEIVGMRATSDFNHNSNFSEARNEVNLNKLSSNHQHSNTKNEVRLSRNDSSSFETYSDNSDLKLTKSEFNSNTIVSAIPITKDNNKVIDLNSIQKNQPAFLTSATKEETSRSVQWESLMVMKRLMDGLD